MALNDGFQYMEQRDSSDAVTKEGVVSKKTSFCTADNKGIYDTIAENFRAIYETTKNLQLISSVAGSRTYTITKNAVSGDTVTIGGVKLTAGTGFAVGTNIVTTANNLVTALNSNATFKATYTATVDSSGIITVTENTAGGGNTPTAAVYTGTIVISSGTATTSASAADQAESIYNTAATVQTLATNAANSATAANTSATAASGSAAAASTSASNAASAAKVYLQRSTTYAVGDVIWDADNLSKAYGLLCTTAGTTGTASPTSWAAVGATTTDGTAVFTTIPKRPTTLATSGITDAIANTGSTAISFAINATDGGLDAVIG